LYRYVQYGLGSTLFPLSLAFSLIVMYDAAGVRRHAGKQAVVGAVTAVELSVRKPSCV
jgi:acid phosphatase family membrane protein YuiD